MSHNRSHRHKSTRKSPATRGADFTPAYIVAVMIGGGLWLLTWLFDQGGAAPRAVALGYVALLTLLAHVEAFRAYRGARLATWQKAFAALPLRMMGFGTRGGRPVDAAHGDARVPRILIATGLVSLAVLAVVAWWLLPEWRLA